MFNKGVDISPSLDTLSSMCLINVILFIFRQLYFNANFFSCQDLKYLLSYYKDNFPNVELVDYVYDTDHTKSLVEKTIGNQVSKKNFYFINYIYFTHV